MSALRPVLEEKTGGLPGALLRAGMVPFGLLWGTAMGVRRRAYERHPSKSTRAPIPVVSVGNIVAGGGGKTPFCAFLVRKLRKAGLRPGVAARGVGAFEGRPGDEEAELRGLLDDLPYAANPDRVRAVDALADRGCDIAVLDDGFQHLRLQRDLDVVLLDATAPFGGGRVLPAGLLREPLSSLAAADALVLTRSDLVDEETLARVASRVSDLAPGRPVFRSVHTADVLVDASGTTRDLAELNGATVLSACGIARPTQFEETLARLGARVAERLRFSDHHRYDGDDLRRMRGRAEAVDADMIVVTCKDLVKLRDLDGSEAAGPPLLALRVRLELVDDTATLDALLAPVVAVAKGSAP